MRRWLTIFLLVLLPLQFSWAVAATYCQHESRTSGHIGHHEHRHQADASGGAETASGGDSSTDDEGANKRKAALAGIDGDCDYCHFSLAKPIAEAEQVPHLQSASHASQPAPLEPASYIPPGSNAPNGAHSPDSVSLRTTSLLC